MIRQLDVLARQGICGRPGDWEWTRLVLPSLSPAAGVRLQVIVGVRSGSGRR